jgi:type III pantothenate kinase
MSAPFLTLDLGNSRCKLRRWRIARGRAPELVAADEFASTRALDGQLATWLEAAGELSGAALSSVAAPELEAALAALLERRFGARFQADLSAGLAIACREPARVGRDRLFAARGAFELARGSCLVLDAGTALTVDALAAPGGEHPTFLGGAIAPGPRLLARALAGGTARLEEVDPRPRPRALGRDTREALEAGVALGFAGAARELVQRIGAESGLGQAPLYLTGGARAFLEEPDLFGARVVRSEPELVHLGLLAASAERGAAE